MGTNYNEFFKKKGYICTVKIPNNKNYPYELSEMWSAKHRWGHVLR